MMGIFSRSKKHSTLDPPPPETSHVHHTPPLPDRPNTSHGRTNGQVPSPAWPVTPPPPYPASPSQPYQQIFVSNYIFPPPQPQSCGKKVKNKLQSASMVHLPQSASMIHLPPVGPD